jgi:minor curlin subunit
MRFALGVVAVSLLFAGVSAAADIGNSAPDIVAHQRVLIDEQLPSIDLPMPAVVGRTAYISQIGDENVVSIHQSTSNAFARVDQTGDRNHANIGQSGSGSSHALAAQVGTANVARIEQGGSGHNLTELIQNGHANRVWIDQTAAGALHNGATLLQSGDENDLRLTQDGGDNRAALSQQGNGNAMTAFQIGEGNRLVWSQQGNNLTDLRIRQSGGAERGGQLLITQTGG